MGKLALLVLLVPAIVAVQAEEQASESSSNKPSNNQFDKDNDNKPIGVDPVETSPDEAVRINTLLHSNIPIHGIPKPLPAPTLIRQFKPSTVATPIQPPNANDIEVTAPTPAFLSSDYSRRLYYNRNVQKPIQFSQSITSPQVHYTEPKDSPKTIIHAPSTISQTERPVYQPNSLPPRPISQPSSSARLIEPKSFPKQVVTFEPTSEQIYLPTTEAATRPPVKIHPIYRYPFYGGTFRPIPRPVATYSLEHNPSVEIIPTSTPTLITEQSYEPLKVTSSEHIQELAFETVPKPLSQPLPVPSTEHTVPKQLSSLEPLPIPEPETSSVPTPQPEPSTDTFPQPIPGPTLPVPKTSPEGAPEPEPYSLPEPYPFPESTSLSETESTVQPTTPRPVTSPAQINALPISPAATSYLPPRYQYSSRPFRPVYNPIPHYTTPLSIPTTPPPHVTFPTHLPKLVPDAISTLESILSPVLQPVTHNVLPYLPHVPRPAPRLESTKISEPSLVPLHEPVPLPVHQAIPPQVPQPIPVPIRQHVSSLVHPPAHVPEHYSSSKPNATYFDNYCTEKNFYYSVENECDTFIECKNYESAEYLCPDGLHFNPNAVWPDYPCAYPSDVHCIGKVSSRPAEPTSECPHRFGFFAIEGDCGRYLICQEGIATVMDCPAGLVFSSETSSCDWPEKVPSCKLEAFLDFICPVPPLDEYGNPSDIVHNYSYGDSCTNYIACHRGHPRLLSCDFGQVFDDVSARCVSSDSPTKCSTF